jgi:hypothetical protein
MKRDHEFTGFNARVHQERSDFIFFESSVFHRSRSGTSLEPANHFSLRLFSMADSDGSLGPDTGYELGGNASGCFPEHDNKRTRACGDDGRHRHL